MNKHLNTVLIKGSLEISEQYSQKNVPREVQQTRLKVLSQRSIKSQHKIQEVIRQITKQQKIAATFIRSILRSVMRKTMKRMLQRLVFKKTAYKLLTSKKKRDIESAFLQLKYNKIRREHAELENLFDRHIELKILSAFIKKKQRENLGVSFENVRNLAARSRKVSVFLQILCEHYHNFIVRFHYLDFFNKMRKLQIVQHQRQIKAEEINKIDKLRVRNLQQSAFVKIMDTILLGQYHETSNVHKSRNQSLTEMTVNRKQVITQLKQQLKTVKTNIDQEKSNRTKVFQQRKKYNNSNKIAMIDVVKKFQKEFKAEEAITKDIKIVFTVRERVISVKNNLRQKAEGSHQLYLNFITLIRQQQGDKIKKITQFRPLFENQLQAFKQSEIYLFKTNAKLQKLIEIYEKRQPYNYQSSYYQLEYQNNVIREMIRAFVRQKSFVEILLRTKKTQQKQQQQEQS